MLGSEVRSDPQGPLTPAWSPGPWGDWVGQTPPPESSWRRSSLGGPGLGEEAGEEGGREGRASVHSISAGWRERGVRSQPGRRFP